MSSDGLERLRRIKAVCKLWCRVARPVIKKFLSNPRHFFSDEDLRLLREAAGCGDVREAWGSYETLMIAHGVPRSTNRSYRIALNSEFGPFLLRRAALDQPLVPHGSRLRARGGGAARRGAHGLLYSD